MEVLVGSADIVEEAGKEVGFVAEMPVWELLGADSLSYVPQLDQLSLPRSIYVICRQVSPVSEALHWANCIEATSLSL